ncbi:MAG: type II toxin-antitoxin system VapC family toxin [Kiritimatiellae bacterium]|nr:type II toxin-antitoxin system VapC family toxin [Kiritimatiellia bacterium]
MPHDLVADTSMIAAFLLREPQGEKFDSVLLQVIAGTMRLRVPALFSFEMLNVLLMAERQKRITPAQQNQLITEWETIPINEHPLLDSLARRRILTHADRYNLTAYDATYLELAEGLNASFLSLNTELLKLKGTLDWIL